MGFNLLHMVCECAALCVSFLIHSYTLFLVLGLVVCRQGGQADIAFIWLWTNSYRYGTYFNREVQVSVQVLHNYKSRGDLMELPVNECINESICNAMISVRRICWYQFLALKDVTCNHKTLFS